MKKSSGYRQDADSLANFTRKRIVWSGSPYANNSNNAWNVNFNNGNDNNNNRNNNKHVRLVRGGKWQCIGI
jgi:hypothetical protein